MSGNYEPIYTSAAVTTEWTGVRETKIGTEIDLKSLARIANTNAENVADNSMSWCAFNRRHG